MSPARHHNALPQGYQLHWYEIDSILGQGGFGITYLARDTNLDQLVAIKEFLPSDLAVRTRESDVQPLTGEHTDTYGWGLNRFLTEARTLAKFRHPNIVRVLSVFEANNTAYMVMEYERGESFENLLKFKQVSGEVALKRILLALLDGLELVHDAGFIHRDIKPSNVYLRDDGVPVLLDFGSARLALGVETRTLTSLVSPGYAPFEQYNATRESDRQGPWTDIYALGATMYRAVTGHGPVDAAARANALLDEQRDPFEPCSGMGLAGYSPGFLLAIDRALAFPPADRPQSVAAWRQLLAAGTEDPEAETLAAVGSADAGAIDIVLDAHESPTPAPAHTATRTVPMAELGERSATTTPDGGSAGRGWFVATAAVALAGVAAAAWISLGPRAPGGTAPKRTAAVPAETPAMASSEPASEPPKEAPRESAAPVGASAPATKTGAPEPPAKAPAAKQVARADPAPDKATTPTRRSEPRTREEKVAALLDSAAGHMDAGRLTEPKRRSALNDYLTVLAMDKGNGTARGGVETIVERSVAMAEEATRAGRLDQASQSLKQARFVLDAMKLRKWPAERYDALFQRYREAGQSLRAAR